MATRRSHNERRKEIGLYVSPLIRPNLLTNNKNIEKGKTNENKGRLEEKVKKKKGVKLKETHVTPDLDWSQCGMIDS